MDFSFKQWMEDAGHTDWGYSNADDPAFAAKMEEEDEETGRQTGLKSNISASSHQRRLGGSPVLKRPSPEARFGKRMKKKLKKT